MVLCVSSGHDCELGGTACPASYNSTAVISVNTLSAQICQTLIDQLARKRRPFLHLIAPSNKACKRQADTDNVTSQKLWNCYNERLENTVWRVGRIVEHDWIIVSLSLSSRADILEWNPAFSKWYNIAIAPKRQLLQDDGQAGDAEVQLSSVSSTEVPIITAKNILKCIAAFI